jgi:osmotically-inducible protein OsmY
MKGDETLNQKIVNQVKQDALLRDAAIVVEICDREITISGNVNKFFKKALICTIARKTTGIKNITDKIMVVLTTSEKFHDAEITNTIAEKLEKNLGSSFKNIAISVTNGQVILKGDLKWKYQKLLATDCISYTDGIVSIQNDITVVSQSEFSVSEKDILAAIYKEEIIQSDISVKLSSKKVTLVGIVPSTFQKKLIEKIVYDLPGVNEIENRLQVVKLKKDINF